MTSSCESECGVPAAGRGIGVWFRVVVVVAAVHIHNVEGEVQEPGVHVRVERMLMEAALEVDAC